MCEKEKDTHHTLKSPLGKKVKSEGKGKLYINVFHIYYSQHSTYNVPGTVLSDLQILTHLIIRTMCTNINPIYR